MPTTRRRMPLVVGFLTFLSTTIIVIESANGGSGGGDNDDRRRTVSTSFGVVRGEIVQPAVSLPAVAQFLGLPYGVAATNQYRFNMAISAPKWTHQPKEATKVAAVCTQSGFQHWSETEALKFTSTQKFDFMHRMLPHLQPQSENCLALNMFVPERPDRSGGPFAPFSVLVLVHGGDFNSGTGNAFNGSLLAAAGQIVVVTLNYRLDVFGFLGRCEGASCLGNAGVADLVVALKQLSNLLPAFDANPDSLTLLGWGSGAALVSLLMASPITQPKTRLFRRAVLLDGSALCPWAMAEHPQQYFMRMAQELQCVNAKKMAKDAPSRQDLFYKHTADLTRCLQEQSVANLTSAARKIRAPSFLTAFAPIVDGQIVPNHPRFSFSPKFGALFRDIDLLVGTVNHPAHHLLANVDLAAGMSVEKRERILRTLVRNLFDFHRTEIYDAIMNEYTDWENPTNSSRGVRDSLLRVLGDVLYTSGLIDTLRAHSTDEAPKVASTYFFTFTHQTRSWAAEQPESEIVGSLSDEHLPYILGYPLAGSNVENVFGRFDDNDAAIARVMMRYISNFVKTGDPSRPAVASSTSKSPLDARFSGVAWPEFNAATREAYLEIGSQPSVRHHYRNAQVGFWSGVVAKLNRGNKERRASEEHHFLPDHFNRQTFYGVVRPYSSFHNEPFPPPPLPPTPFPNDIKRPPTSAIVAVVTPTPTASSSDAQNKDANTVYQAIAGVAVVAVIALVINICCYIAVARKYMDLKRVTKKPVHYQSYMSHNPGPMTAGTIDTAAYGPLPALSSQLLMPSTALHGDSKIVASPDTMRRSAASREDVTRGMEARLHALGGRNASLPPPFFSLLAGGARQSLVDVAGGRLYEQEPLLASTPKAPPPPLIRAGISPTCPRHGKAAQMMLNSSRANSVGSSLLVNTPIATLEEVQV